MKRGWELNLREGGIEKLLWVAWGKRNLANRVKRLQENRLDLTILEN